MINDVTRPDRGFKVRRLHKLFLAWFWGRGNKQTSYNVMSQSHISKTVYERLYNWCRRMTQTSLSSVASDVLALAWPESHGFGLA